MDWIQFCGLLITILAGFGFLYKEIKDEIKLLKGEFSDQSKRTDRLYEMFIDLIKEVKK